MFPSLSRALGLQNANLRIMFCNSLSAALCYSLVLRALHLHRKGVSLILSKEHIVDEFLPTIPGLNFDISPRDYITLKFNKFL